MKLLADVNVSVLVVARLRTAGVDVVRVCEFMDARSPDSDIVRSALERGAVLLSHDQDFSAMLAMNGAAKPSLLNLRTSSVDPDFLSQCILRALTEAAPELQAGAIVTVEDGGARVRRLPIGGE